MNTHVRTPSVDTSNNQRPDFGSFIHLAPLCRVVALILIGTLAQASCGGRNKRAESVPPATQPSVVTQPVDAAAERDAASKAASGDGWRFQLAGLRPTPALWVWLGTGGGDGSAKEGDEAAAFIHAARWRRALASLATRDARLAERVRTAVAGTIEPPGAGGAGGRVSVFPAWNSAEQASQLLDAIETLHAGASAASVDRVRTLLDDHPATLAWVIDDGAATGGGVGGAGGTAAGGAVVNVGVANLSDAPMLASAGASDTNDHGAARAPGDGHEPELAAVLTMGTRTLRVPVSASARTIDIRIGGSEIGQRAQLVRRVEGVMEARPPGVNIGPLCLGWTMDVWLNAASRPDEWMGGGGGRGMSLADRRGLSAWQSEYLALHDARAAAARTSGDDAASATITAGRLYRDVQGGAGGGNGAASIKEGWVLYVECAGTPHDSLGDELHLWLGPLGAPRAVLVVTPDGRVRDDLGVLADSTAQAAAMGVQKDGKTEAGAGWRAWVPIPPSCVDTLGDGSHVLRLGVIRQGRGDGVAGRTSWPRAMTPWQVEPGRAAIGLDSWER